MGENQNRLVRSELTRLHSSLKLDRYHGNAVTQTAVETNYYRGFKINSLFLGLAYEVEGCRSSTG